MCLFCPILISKVSTFVAEYIELTHLVEVYHSLLLPLVMCTGKDEDNLHKQFLSTLYLLGCYLDE